MVCPRLATEPLVQRGAPGAEELDLERAACLRDRVLGTHQASAETARRPRRVPEFELDDVPNPNRIELLIEVAGVELG